MEFWGEEVKPGTPLKVAPEEDNLIHISQATLDCKGKMGESVVLTVTVDKKKFVIGTLSQEKFPQISFDLVFEKEFELSHNCTKGSVHFIGYRSPNIEQEEDDFFSGSDEEEEVPEAVPAAVPANGNAGAAASNVVKADSKPKAKPAEVKPESDEDEDDSDEEDDSEKGMDVDEDDSDDDEDSEDEEEEETLKKPEPVNKKRPNESASKTPVSGKKAKPAAAPAATPQKTEEKKKGGHTATPHPAKKGGKSPVNANQSPKSGGQSSSGNKKKKKQSKKEDKPVKSYRFPEPAKRILVKTCAVKGIIPSYEGGPGGFDTRGVTVIGESSSSSSMNNDFNKVKTFDIRGVTETAAK